MQEKPMPLSQKANQLLRRKEIQELNVEEVK